MTATAYDRFLVASQADDILMGAPAIGTPEADGVIDELSSASSVVDDVVDPAQVLRQE